MVYTRSKLKLNKTLYPPTTTNIFKTLISALESPEGIKSQLLKSSYYLLIQLSSKQQLCLGKGTDLNELFMKTNDGEVRLSLRDVYTLSNFLFKDLQRRWKQLQFSKHDISASRSLEFEELNLLIRCCMVTLTFCVPQQHLLESGRILLLIFKKLSLLEVAGSHGNVEFKKSYSCQCMYSGEKSSDSFAKVASLSSLELFEPCVPSITAILEAPVFQYPTLRMAAKFQEIQTLYVSNASVANDSMVTEDVGSVAFSMECVEKTCRGEMYLKMRLKGSHGVDDFDDLADFVECKKGKDYVGWLKSRDKFRERKLSKGVKRRWEKKKQAWRSMKGKT